jgi:hypothetical protein
VKVLDVLIGGRRRCTGPAQYECGDDQAHEWAHNLEGERGAPEMVEQDRPSDGLEAGDTQPGGGPRQRSENHHLSGATAECSKALTMTAEAGMQGAAVTNHVASMARGGSALLVPATVHVILKLAEGHRPSRRARRARGNADMGHNHLGAATDLLELDAHLCRGR